MLSTQKLKPEPKNPLLVKTPVGERSDEAEVFPWKKTRVPKPVLPASGIPPVEVFPWKKTRVPLPNVSEQPGEIETLGGVVPDDNQPAPTLTTKPVKPMTRKEQLKAEIEERSSRKFADKWGILDTFKGAGIGFLKAFAMTDPRMPVGDRLLQALGGAGAGAVQGTIDPNTDEKWSNENKLARLYGLYDQEQKFEEDAAKQLKAEQEAIKAQFETEGAFLKNQSDAVKFQRLVGDPYWQVVLNKKEITGEDAQKLKDLGYGDLPPASWQQIKEDFVNGKPFARKEFDPDWQRNYTLPIKPDEEPVPVTIGSQTLPATPKTALNPLATAAQANANREMQMSQFQQKQETEEKEKQYKSQKEYEDDRRARDSRVRAATADLKKAQTKLASLKKSKEEAAALGKETTTYDTQIAEAEGAIEAAKEAMNEPAPKKVIRPKVQNPRRSNKKSYSQDDILRVLKQ